MVKGLITATESKCAIHTQSRGSSLASKCTPHPDICWKIIHSFHWQSYYQNNTF